MYYVSVFGFDEPIERTKLQFFSDICKLLSEIITIFVEFVHCAAICRGIRQFRQYVKPEEGYHLQ